MILAPYQAPLDQAWLRLWVGLYGPDSRLARYLNGEACNGISPPVARPGTLDDQARKPARRQSRQAKVEKKTRDSGKVARSPAERAAKRLDRDIERVTRLPVSEWAKQIVGDERIAQITLQDIIDGIEDYFNIFGQLRRHDPEAYAYFSRVGAPIIMDGTVNYWSAIEALEIGDPAALPSFFGGFIPRNNEDFRRDILAEKDTYGFDFHLFMKPKNYATVAPPGMTVFQHTQYSLKRPVLFTRQEIKQHRWASHTWGCSWFVGVSPHGQTRALPVRFNKSQSLPNGGTVHHTGFKIPEGLYIWAKEKQKIKTPGGREEETTSPHDVVRRIFNMGVAFTAAAVSGIQVTVSKGGQRARFGVPISNLKNFFADRDPDGARRKAILHYMPGHDRHMQDGRIIEVGEHLRGNRFFKWRGYDIQVAVPGIHYASPEGLNGPLYQLGDPEAPLPPEFYEHNPDDLIGLPKIGKIIQRNIDKRRRVEIRKGMPETTYTGSKLPKFSRPQR